MRKITWSLASLKLQLSDKWPCIWLWSTLIERGAHGRLNDSKVSRSVLDSCRYGVFRLHQTRSRLSKRHCSRTSCGLFQVYLCKYKRRWWDFFLERKCILMATLLNQPFSKRINCLLLTFVIPMEVVRLFHSCVFTCLRLYLPNLIFFLI